MKKLYFGIYLAVFQMLLGGDRLVDLQKRDVLTGIPSPSSSFLVPEVGMVDFVNKIGPFLVMYCGFESEESGDIVIVIKEPDFGTAYWMYMFDIRDSEWLNRGKWEERIEHSKGRAKISYRVAEVLFARFVEMTLKTKYGERGLSTGRKLPTQIIATMTMRTGLMIGYSEGLDDRSDVKTCARLGRAMREYVRNPDRRDEESWIRLFEGNATETEPSVRVKVSPSSETPSTMNVTDAQPVETKAPPGNGEGQGHAVTCDKPDPTPPAPNATGAQPAETKSPPPAQTPR